MSGNSQFASFRRHSSRVGAGVCGVLILACFCLTPKLLAVETASAPRSISPPPPEQVVAAVLIAEAGGEGRPGLAAVMEVIQTRARQKRISWSRVVLEPKQFACMNKATPVGLVNKWKKHALWNEAVRLGSYGTATSTTRGATHFEMKSRRPRWANRATVTATVGNHKFYRLNST